ncbi:hypothetical protein E2C01_045497 [Portunus trituberculatus]|uniref:Uncharacterized protein n=1 Tax=Portunus trituberculatus TaxID=210409 RepID=A0A5B7G1C9_PORTR|nr:hypothetical protein [Portunus trituberculatus]
MQHTHRRYRVEGVVCVSLPCVCSVYKSFWCSEYTVQVSVSGVRSIERFLLLESFLLTFASLDEVTLETD